MIQRGALPLFIFSAANDGRWHPGIGDPTVEGWVAAISYLAAGVLCLRRAWMGLREPAARRGATAFWSACGVLMLLLSLNKQLDLQTLATQLGRDWIAALGWYEGRRTIQAIFVVVLAAVSAASLLVMYWLIEGAARHYYVALAGLLVTGVFVLIRAASIHHLEEYFGFQPAEFSQRWLLELSGALMLAAAALVRESPPESRTADSAEKPAPTP